MTAQNINLEELLKELGPETLQALEQLLAEDAPTVRKTIQNILDEPISDKVEKSLRVNVSKNQRKTVKSRPRSKNRFRSFFVYSKFKVLNKVKWG